MLASPDRALPDPVLERLADHLTYVEQIEEDIARLKTRLEHTSDARQARTVRADITRLDKRRKAELARLEGSVNAHPEWGRRFALVLSIPGIGARTALALVIRLPEMTTLSREHAAALAGLAPFVHQRQTRRPNPYRRRTQQAATLPLHGRLCHSTSLEPAAQAFYTRLTQRGIAARSAIVACARKLLTYAITIVQRGTPWTEQPVHAAETP